MSSYDVNAEGGNRPLGLPPVEARTSESREERDSRLPQLVEANAREAAQLTGGGVEDARHGWKRVRWPSPVGQSVNNIMHIGPHEAVAHITLTHQQAIEFAMLVNDWRGDSSASELD